MKHGLNLGVQPQSQQNETRLPGLLILYERVERARDLRSRLIDKFWV